MPIRIVCPSCSAALSIKDELAGRALKCPKCGEVIPASQSPPSTQSAPTPSPQKSPFEELDEPAKPAKTGSKVTGQPAARAKKVDEDEEERPTKKRKKRDEDEDEDDRPARGKKRGSNDAATAAAVAAGGGGMMLALVGGGLLVCCLGVGGVGYYIYTRVTKGMEEVRKELEKVDKQNPPANTSPAIEVKAEDIAKAYKDDKVATDNKYKGKNVLVEGKLEDIDFMPFGDVYARLQGASGNQVRCVVVKKDVNKLLDTSRGQTLKLKGKCDGLNAIFVDVLDATIENVGSDPGQKVTAAGLLNEYERNSMATNEKYNDKAIIISSAVVDSKEGEATLIVRGIKQAGTTKIKITLPVSSREQIANLKPGDLVKTIRGEYAGSSGGFIIINRAWIVP